MHIVWQLTCYKSTSLKNFAYEWEVILGTISFAGIDGNLFLTRLLHCQKLPTANQKQMTVFVCTLHIQSLNLVDVLKHLKHGFHVIFGAANKWIYTVTTYTIINENTK